MNQGGGRDPQDRGRPGQAQGPVGTALPQDPQVLPVDGAQATAVHAQAIHRQGNDGHVEPRPAQRERGVAHLPQQPQRLAR